MKRRVLLGLLAAAVALPLAGCLYETTAAARAARRFPPPGRLVDVGGRRLHLLCIGSGRPIVVFEASGFSNSASSSAARAGLARYATVCSYDRAGVGWSDPGPDPMSAGQMADDLRRLHETAQLDPPFVFVASSIGGLVSELFARRYPDRVAGLVFADAANSGMLSVVSEGTDAGAWREVRAACRAAGAAGRIGLVRLFDPWGFRRESSPDADRSAALMYGARPWQALCALVRSLPDTVEEFRRAPALRSDLPLVVLSAQRSDDLLPAGLLLPADLQQRGAMGDLLRQLRQTHERLARQSSRGSWQVVRDSGHLIASDRPQVVIDATVSVLRQVSGRWEDR